MGRPEPAVLGDQDPLPAGVVDGPLPVSTERPRDQLDPWIGRHRDHDDGPPGRGGEHGQMVPDQRIGLGRHRKRFARTRLRGAGQQ
jgi:hypothetical protein